MSASPAKPIPEGMHSLTPHWVCTVAVINSKCVGSPCLASASTSLKGTRKQRA